MIKKILFIFVIIFLGVFFSTAQCNPTDTFKLGVSLIEEIPQMLFGAWRVSSELIETDSPEKFKKTSTDIWNLSKHGDVIKLSNPFSGASATVKLEYVKQNRIKSSDPLGRAAPILKSRRYFIMRWGNSASLLVMSSDYEFMA